MESKESMRELRLKFIENPHEKMELKKIPVNDHEPIEETGSGKQLDGFGITMYKFKGDEVQTVSLYIDRKDAKQDGLNAKGVSRMVVYINYLLAKAQE